MGVSGLLDGLPFRARASNLALAKVLDFAMSRAVSRESPEAALAVRLSKI
jgi:hypothetical protein